MIIRKDKIKNMNGTPDVSLNLEISNDRRPTTSGSSSSSVKSSKSECPRYTLYTVRDPPNGMICTVRDILEKNGNDVTINELSWKKFADGWPNLSVSGVKDKLSEVVLFLDMFRPETVFDELSITHKLSNMVGSRLVVVLPYLAPATMEREDTEESVSTASIFCQLISSVLKPESRIIIVDVHANAIRHYFKNGIMPSLVTGVSLLMEKISTSLDEQNKRVLSFAYPDDGATKRFERHLKYLCEEYGIEYDSIVCSKARKGDRRDVTIASGDPNGRYVIIVDDIAQTGGTLVECQRAIAAAGAKHVSAYTTHAVFPKDKHEMILPERDQDPSSGFHKFYITDSCAETANKLKDRAPFQVISLAKLIAEKLMQ